jgi:hypothetical protein
MTRGVTKRLVRIALWASLVVVGLCVAAWGTLRLFGFGPATIVVKHVGSDGVQTVTIAEVSEGLREPLLEHPPVRLGPGESAEIGPGRRQDAELDLVLVDAHGARRRVALRGYLSHGHRLRIEVEIADGQVTRARVRRGWGEDFQALTWTAE